jgi:hypothetical protein
MRDSIGGALGCLRRGRSRPAFSRSRVRRLRDRWRFGRAVDTDIDRDSTTCAEAMMAHNTVSMISATRAALDCADIAAAAQRVLSRSTAADRCAAECGQHASHHGDCRVHSKTAQRAADLADRNFRTSPSPARSCRPRRPPGVHRATWYGSRPTPRAGRRPDSAASVVTWRQW